MQPHRKETTTKNNNQSHLGFYRRYKAGRNTPRLLPEAKFVELNPF